MAILKLPAGYDSSRNYTLLVALHGSGGTAAGLAPTFLSLARASVFVAVPQGEYRISAGGYSWFYLTSDRSLWEEYDTRSVGGVVTLIADIRARYRIGRVFVLGFSQGASLAYMTGLRNPSLVSGILAISGYMPEIDGVGSIVHAQDVADARNVNIFVARGGSDDLVSRQTYTAQRDFFASNGYSVTAYEFAGGHYLTDELLGQVLQWLRGQPGR
jgi:phospholipase/carboxylesterase